MQLRKKCCCCQTRGQKKKSEFLIRGWATAAAQGIKAIKAACRPQPGDPSLSTTLWPLSGSIGPSKYPWNTRNAQTLHNAFVKSVTTQGKRSVQTDPGKMVSIIENYFVKSLYFICFSAFTCFYVYHLIHHDWHPWRLCCLLVLWTTVCYDRVVVFELLSGLLFLSKFFWLVAHQ